MRVPYPAVTAPFEMLFAPKAMSVRFSFSSALFSKPTFVPST